jgi:hypothetical protein
MSRVFDPYPFANNASATQSSGLLRDIPPERRSTHAIFEPGQLGFITTSTYRRVPLFSITGFPRRA